MNKKMIVFVLIATLVLSTLTAFGVGKGPNYNGNETIKGERFISHEEMTTQLERYARQSDRIELEVIGQSVKGRDLFLVKFGEYDESKPTVLYLTQQHGNEVIPTEGVMNVLRNLSGNSKEVRELADKVNVLFVPMINPDGGCGDVNFDISHYVGGGLATRANANGFDLNRDHNALTQPETRALHENVLQKYNIDYMIDFHNQGSRSGIDGELVSGSILYPTNPDVKPEVVEAAKKFGIVAYEAVNAKGWGLLARYNGGTANTIARNGLANEYDIAMLLVEVRGMLDHSWEGAVLGQKSNGYLIEQTVLIMEETMEAIAYGSIHDADMSIWDTMPVQTWIPLEGEVMSGE